MVRIQLEDRGYLDVKEGTYFPLNYALGDIRDISKRSGVFSKTITLSGTDNNHNLLNHYYDVNIVSGDFDINQLTKCSVIQDGVVILENGYLQLIEVVKSQDTNAHEQRVEYQVLVKDSVSDFFTALGTKELTDINLSEYDHTYTAVNVTGSFSNDITNGYKYLLPYIPTNDYNLQHCHPAIYAKLYFDKIFTQNGYTYEWGNLTPTSGTTSDGNYFEKLLIPYNGGEPKIDTDDSRVVATKGSYTNSFNLTLSTAYPDYLYLLGYWVETVDNTTEVVDNDGLYNPTTGVYTSPANISSPENITFNVELTYSLRLVNNEAGAVTLSTLQQSIDPYLNITSVAPMGGGIYNQVSLDTFTLSNSYPTGTTTLISSQTTNASFPVTNIASAQDIYINTGLKFHNPNLPVFNQWFQYSGADANVDLELVVTSFKVTAEISAVYGFNDTLSVSQYIPQKIKQSDYIKSIFMMYNLYAEVDKSNPNKLILNTRDDYYDAGTEVDWTDKISKDREQNLKFLPELASKKMLLTYKPDSDDPNKVYTEATSDTYGQLRFTFENEYTRGEDKKELIFSPTPHTKSSFGAYLPMLSVIPQTNVRILIDGGTDTCNPFNVYDYTVIDPLSGTSVGYGQTAQTTYPIITHFDDPLNPTFDLNFATCDFYFYSELNSRTNNTLFNNYWRRTLGQIDKGKMLTAYFALTESDIQKLNLNDKIRINNSWWNINKVIDYNANARGFTKVELISVDEESKLTRFAITSDTTTKPEVSVLGTVPTKPNRPIKPTKPNTAPATFGLVSDYNKTANTALPWQDIKFMGRGNTASGDVKGAIIIGEDKYITQDGVYASRLEAFDSFILGGTEIVDVATITDNFASADLTFTGDRSHNTDGNYLEITTDNGGYTGGYYYIGSAVKGSPLMWAGYENQFIEATATDLTLYYSNLNRLQLKSTELVINDTGASYDTRIEGDTDANLLFVDASTDRVGIGTATPAAKLDVNGSVIFNDSAGNNDFRVEGQTDANLLFTDASTDRVGIGTSSPSYKLDIQSTTANINVKSTGGISKIDIDGSTGNDSQIFFKENGTFKWGVFSDASLGADFRVYNYVAGAASIHIDSTTNKLGINTITPSYQLDVNGDINVVSGSAYYHNATAGLSGTYNFGGGTTGDIATMTFSGGILTAVTTVP